MKLENLNNLETENMSDTTQLLRFITAGSVDDGKSTLIGRLLHDSKSIFEDQFTAISKTSERRGMGAVDLSLLTDEERMVQDTVGRFVDEKVLPIIGDCFDQGRFPKELIPEIAALGLLGATKARAQNGGSPVVPEA